MPGRKTLAASIIALLSTPAFADTVQVTSAADSGAGSYRAAVEAANADSSIDTIEFNSGLIISLLSEVNYTGTQNLQLLGWGSTLVGNCEPAETWDSGLFASHSAADILIWNLDFINSCNNGVAVFIPKKASGTIEVTLSQVEISGARFHGLFVDGQDSTGIYNTDDVPHPNCFDPHPYDSRASIDLLVEYSNVDNNGNMLPNWDLPVPIYEENRGGGGDLVGLTGCPADYDGIRVDDGGHGNIIAEFRQSTANGNLADGIELDETGNGSVRSTAFGLVVNDNGDTTAYEIYDPKNDETISDLDDGFDIDEAGPGNLVATFSDVEVSDNRDEGLDMDEAGPGLASVYLEYGEANRNEDQGFKVDEEDDGDLIAVIRHSDVNESLSQHGVELAETGSGNVRASIEYSTVTGNDDAAFAGEQEDGGYGLLRVIRSNLSGNGDPSFDVDGISVYLYGSFAD